MAIIASIRIDLSESTNGHIISRVAVGCDTTRPIREGFTADVPNFAILDHVFRKLKDSMLLAEDQLKKQLTLQDLTPKNDIPKLKVRKSK